MSFDWNLSSDDEEFQEKWEKEREDFLTSNDHAAVHNNEDGTKTSTAVFNGQSEIWDDEEFFSEEENIDWEDGEDRKPAAVPFPEKEITIDLRNNNSEDDRKPHAKKRKRVSRSKIRLESIDKESQLLLIHLNRAHLLSLIGHCQHISCSCIDETLQAAALSILPNNLLFNLRPSPHKCIVYSDAKEICSWYFDRIHSVERKRNAARRRNARAGAPQVKLSGRLQDIKATPTHSLSSTLAFARYLSPVLDSDPQLYSGPTAFHDLDKLCLLIAIIRSLSCRVRLVGILEPMSLDLHVGHPILMQSGNFFHRVDNGATENKSGNNGHPQENVSVESMKIWLEVLCAEESKRKPRWVSVEPMERIFDAPDEIESSYLKSNRTAGGSLSAVPYAIAVEHAFVDERRLKKFTDVTPRYSKSYIESLKSRGDIRNKRSLVSLDDRKSWFAHTLEILNDHRKSGRSANDAIPLDGLDRLNDDIDEHEKEELKRSANNEILPTSKAAFQTHPIYVIPSVLGKTEVLHPESKKRVCGIFKGEKVYRRSDVSIARPARKWLYEGRKVNMEEIENPVKVVKARKKPRNGKFKALKSYGVGATNHGSEEQIQLQLDAAKKPLEDDMDKLYGVWQTHRWSPDPVGPGEAIPCNEFGNIELDLLNPGLVHIDIKGIAPVAKKLGIPYAPCLLGFEGHGGNRTPSIRGIVVHEHNADLLMEAGAEVEQHQAIEHERKRKDAVYLRWKKLFVGLLTKERLEKEYGGN